MSIACMALRARFSSTCSTSVRSHSTRRQAVFERELDAHAELARLQPHQRQHRVEQRLRRDGLARAVAPAHEVVHAADHLAGAVGLLGDAAHRHRDLAVVAACCAWPAAAAG